MYTSSTSESIAHILKDINIRIGLYMSNLRGQCYNRASTMIAVYKDI